MLFCAISFSKWMASCIISLYSRRLATIPQVFLILIKHTIIVSSIQVSVPRIKMLTVQPVTRSHPAVFTLLNLHLNGPGTLSGGVPVQSLILVRTSWKLPEGGPVAFQHLAEGGG
jgi:hypothetical protein